MSDESVIWLEEVGKEDISIVGGKGASLGEMIRAELPVPSGFAVTAQAFRRYIDENGIHDKLFSSLDVDVDDANILRESERKAKEIIMDGKIPDDIEKSIRSKYIELCKRQNEDVFVAVRSSATAEDLPDASFAGQQDTFLNIKGEDEVISAVKKCWASLYGARAIYYRVKQGFDHSKVNLCAVVQCMVDAEKAGVMFSSHPSSGEAVAIIEGAWGLGETVVSGTVSPDYYVVDRQTRKINERRIATKNVMHKKDPRTGKTIDIPVPQNMKTKQVLDDIELMKLVDFAEILEELYGIPQDIEWAIKDKQVFILQSRPITTINKKKEQKEKMNRSAILEGLGASPGVVYGKVKLVSDSNELGKVKLGDILVAVMTTPDMVPAMKRAGAIVTDEGGLTCIEGDAKLFTNKGFIKMKEVGNLLSKREEIKTLSIDSKTKKVVWRNVLLSMKRKAKTLEIAPYLNLTNKLGDKIKITPDHKMPILEGNNLKALELKDIIDKKQNLFVIDNIPKIDTNINLEIFDNHKLMYLCGSIFSDGHIVKRESGKPMRVMFSQKVTPEKQPYIDTVLNYFNDIFNANLKNYTAPSATVSYKGSELERAGSFECSQAYPAQTLQSLKDNFVQIISSIEEEYVASFLAGIIDGDGHFNKQKSWIEIYVNKNHTNIIDSIVIACLRLNSYPEVIQKGENLFVIKIKDNVAKLTEKCQRVKAIEKNIKDRKLFDSKVFKSLNLKDWRGNLYNYNKYNKFIGVNWLLNYLDGRCEEEKLSQIRELVNSDLRMQKLMVVGESDLIDVYNITVDAPTEEDHNYVVFTEKYTPLFVYNCHAAIVSRELGCPAVVGTRKATQVLTDDMEITVDGEKGLVYEGKIETKAKPKTESEKTISFAKSKPLTATEVKVNVSIPEATSRAVETQADGVGLLRIEHMILGLPKHPKQYIKEGKADEYVMELVSRIQTVVSAFYPKPVWVRTLDAPTDEFRAMEGGDGEPIEPNPMLGYRGIRRDLIDTEHFELEVRAFKELLKRGYNNMGIMIPLVQHPSELKRAKEFMQKNGLDIDKIDIGIMVEIPAAALIIDEFIAEGLDFVSFGTNDLTQYTLAVDRNNEHVAHLYAETHPAVMKLIEGVIIACNKAGVKTSICGQAGSYPHVAKRLVELGITSISANIDAVESVREMVARTELQILLKAAREKK